jgi:hypothetical protein
LPIVILSKNEFETESSRGPLRRVAFNEGVTKGEIPERRYDRCDNSNLNGTLLMTDVISVAINSRVISTCGKELILDSSTDNSEQEEEEVE